MVKKTIAAIFSVLVLSTVLTACNTTRGVGETSRTVVVRSWRCNQSSAVIINGTAWRRTVNRFSPEA